MAEVTDVTATKKLHVQLGVPFFIIVGFVIGILIFGTLYFGAKAGGGSVKEAPDYIATNASSAISDFLTPIQKAVGKAAESSSGLLFSEDAKTEIISILSFNRDILALRYFNDQGVEVYELHKSRTGEDVLSVISNPSLYTETARGKSEPYLIFSSNVQSVSQALYIVVPLRNGESIFAGFMVAAIDASNLSEILKTLSSGAPTKIYIANESSAQVLLLHSTLTSVLKNDGTTKEKIQQLFLNNKKEFGYDTDSGVSVVAAWEKIAATEWNIVVETLPSDSFSRGGITIFVIGTIFIFIFIGLSFLFLYVFNAKLIQPLRKIEKAMHYYRTGDYAEEIKVGTKNEFAAIAQLLNTMARNVENNTSERVSQLKKVLDRQNTDTKLLIEKDVELRENSQKLKELDSAKSMFVSVAAHQMRTPLAAVKWSIKLVMDGDVGPVNAEQIEYLTKGYDSTTRMINLINDLLNVDKIESDKFTYEFKPESLIDILQGIVDDLTPLANEKGVNIRFEHAAGTLPQINADKVKLTNALQNLIDNAIKYTIGGGDVTIKLAQLEGLYKLSVADTGIGIPLSEQSKVFGKFFRAKNAVRQQTDGSGLGLFIVKKIIEKHDGAVVFESKEKVGTTFFIEIPILKK